MIRAALFMAKFGESGDDGHPLPPVEMGVASWKDAYERLFRGLPHNYSSFKSFRNSIGTDRHHYLQVLSGKKPDSDARREILGSWVRASRAKFWKYIQQHLDGKGSHQQLVFTLPEEILAVGLTEGAVRTITVNAYERNPRARQQCIAAHGTDCCICGFSFGAVYGPEADGYIHVHHVRPLSEIGGEYVVDAVNDLRPVCPNCHAMLHMSGKCRTIDDVRRLLER
jgi:predicted HNH restriction endonuclease